MLKTCPGHAAVEPNEAVGPLQKKGRKPKKNAIGANAVQKQVRAMAGPEAVSDTVGEDQQEAKTVRAGANAMLKTGPGCGWAK